MPQNQQQHTISDHHVGATIIGAGAIGLACARALALRGINTLILEQHGRIGEETSSRNSEVIHAGLYYPPGSLKAQLCVEGRQRLYDYCRSRHLPYHRCGKLIVATDSAQEDALAAIAQRAASNGVDDLQPLTARAAQALEPQLHCAAALRSPSTGIFDSHAYLHALLADAQAHGATLALHTPLLAGEYEGCGWRLYSGGAEAFSFTSELLINAAGLAAPRVAARLGLGKTSEHMPPHNAPPTAHYAKGHYYALHGRSPFSQLVYPVPEPGGLGVHLTLDLAGAARFGPDVAWLDTSPVDGHFDYRFAHDRRQAFAQAIRRYWPQLPDDALSPAYTGIRPKLADASGGEQDFLIDTRHPGLIQLLGIESPGLTASLALAAAVCQRLGLADPV